MMRRLEVFVFAAAIATAMTACDKDDKAPVADSLDAIDTVKPLESPSVGDSLNADSSRIQNPSAPPQPAPRGALPPPGGEMSRRGSSTMAPRDPAPPNDPPPNLIGETRRDGSTMSPTTRPRDSVVGPKFEIDSRGKVTPIKR